jgi:hypothetical protein
LIAFLAARRQSPQGTGKNCKTFSAATPRRPDIEGFGAKLKNSRRTRKVEFAQTFLKFEFGLQGSSNLGRFGLLAAVGAFSLRAEFMLDDMFLLGVPEGCEPLVRESVLACTFMGISSQVRRCAGEETTGDGIPRMAGARKDARIRSAPGLAPTAPSRGVFDPCGVGG